MPVAGQAHLGKSQHLYAEAMRFGCVSFDRAEIDRLVAGNMAELDDAAFQHFFHPGAVEKRQVRALPRTRWVP